MPHPIAFPAWLKYARLEHGLTQAQLADQAGISLSLLRKYESGQRSPPRSTALRLAIALAIPADELDLFLSAARSLPPPVSAPATPAPNLPAAPTPLLGREDDLARLQATLHAAPGRLVTLLGPPGVGKSRLALAAAEALAPQFAAGSAFVELAPLSAEAALVPPLATALGAPGITDEAALLALAATRTMLIVLDNCEHLPDVAPLVARLLTAAPRLTLLATSRTPLRLRAELRFPLAPLAMPTSNRLASIASAPATRLFCERAAAVTPGFALNAANATAIATLCRRLDGLPLALELAAARSDHLDPYALLSSLEADLTALEGSFVDLPPHQRTLQATIAWSEHLLAPDDQAAFARLGVFWGSFDPPAAAAVGVAATQLTTLSEAGLLQPFADGRWRLLETLRTYAREQLALRPEAHESHAHHAAHYASIAEAQAPLLSGASALAAMARLDTDLPNLRAALTWSLEHDGGVIAARITAALRVYWLSRGAVREGRMVEPLLADDVGSRIPAALRVRAMLTTGYIASQQGIHGFHRQIEQGLELARQHGTPADITLGLILSGMIARFPGNLPTCIALLNEAVTLARQLERPFLLAYALNQLGFSYTCDGWYRQGLPALEEAVQLTAAAGEQVMHYRYRSDLGEAMRAMGDLVGARRILTQLLAELGPNVDQTTTWESHLRLACVALEEGQFTAAEQSLSAADRLVTHLGIAYGRAYLLRWQGQLALARGERAAASTVLPEAKQWALKMYSIDQLAAVLALQAQLALDEGDSQRAARLCGSSNGLVSRFSLRADRLVDPLRLSVQTRLDPDAQALAASVAHFIIERIPSTTFPSAEVARDTLRIDRLLATVLRGTGMP